MKFLILSKAKIHAVDDKLTEFIAEDLAQAIESANSLVLTSEEHVDTIRKENPFHKFEYEITITRKNG